MCVVPLPVIPVCLLPPDQPHVPCRDGCCSQVLHCRWGSGCRSSRCLRAQRRSRFLLGASSDPAEVPPLLPSVLGPGEGSGIHPAGPVLVVRAFLQTCPLRLSPLGLGKGPRDLPAAGGVAGSPLPTPDGAPGLAHLSPPGHCTSPTPSPPVPSPHVLLSVSSQAAAPASLLPVHLPPLPSPLAPLLESLLFPPQPQGGMLSTRLQSHPGQPSRRSRSPRSRPPLPSPTAPSVRAGGGGQGTIWAGGGRCRVPARGGEAAAGLAGLCVAAAWGGQSLSPAGPVRAVGSGPCVHPRPQPCCPLRWLGAGGGCQDPQPQPHRIKL